MRIFDDFLMKNDHRSSKNEKNDIGILPTSFFMVFLSVRLVFEVIASKKKKSMRYNILVLAIAGDFNAISTRSGTCMSTVY